LKNIENADEIIDVLDADGVDIESRLSKAANLSDLVSVTTARSNLGLGTAAVANSSDFLQKSNNLSDLTSASNARANLGLGTAAVANSSAFDAAGTATSAVAAHVALPDPHPQYTDASELSSAVSAGVATAEAFSIQRANHTGTQNLTTIVGGTVDTFSGFSSSGVLTSIDEWVRNTFNGATITQSLTPIPSVVPTNNILNMHNAYLNPTGNITLDSFYFQATDYNLNGTFEFSNIVGHDFYLSQTGNSDITGTINAMPLLVNLGLGGGSSSSQSVYGYLANLRALTGHVTNGLYPISGTFQVDATSTADNVGLLSLGGSVDGIITNSITGVDFSPTISSGASVNNITGTNQNPSIDENVTSYTAHQVSGYGAGDLVNYNGFNSQIGISGIIANHTGFRSSIANASSVTNFTGFDTYLSTPGDFWTGARFGVDSNFESFTGLSLQLNGDGSGTNSSMYGVNLSTTGDYQNFQGVQISPNGGDHDQLFGLQVNPNFGEVRQFYGVNISPVGLVYSDLQALAVDLSQVTIESREVTNVITVADVAGSLNNTYFFLNEPSPGNGQYYWFDVNGAGVDPGPFGARVSIQVPIATNATANQVATALHSAITGAFIATVNSNSVTISNTVAGVVTTATAETSGFTIEIYHTGSAYGNRIGLNINEGLIQASYTLLNPPPADFPNPIIGHNIGSTLQVDSGSPLTDDYIFTNFIYGNILADDDIALDSGGFGIAGVLNLNQMQIAATKTVAKVTNMFSVGTIVPASSGGTLTDFNFFRTAFSNQGGSLTIDNMYGFHFEAGISANATNTWGLYVADTGAQNYLENSLSIGATTVTNSEIALEIGSKKAVVVGRLTAAEIAAIAAPIGGMIVYDTTLGRLTFYDDVLNLWVTL
jgi:hypothetical protein